MNLHKKNNQYISWCKKKNNRARIDRGRVAEMRQRTNTKGGVCWNGRRKERWFLIVVHEKCVWGNQWIWLCVGKKIGGIGTVSLARGRRKRWEAAEWEGSWRKSSFKQEMKALFDEKVRSELLRHCRNFGDDGRQEEYSLILIGLYRSEWTLPFWMDQNLVNSLEGEKPQRLLNYCLDHALVIELFFVNNWLLNNLISKP